MSTDRIRAFFCVPSGTRLELEYVDVMSVNLSVARDSKKLRHLRDNLMALVHELSDELTLVERQEREG